MLFQHPEGREKDPRPGSLSALEIAPIDMFLNFPRGERMLPWALRFLVKGDTAPAVAQ